MNREDQVLEPTMGTELSPTMEPEPSLATTVPASATPPKRYWQAQSFADTLRREFDQARHQGNMSLMREQFYLLANYYTRTTAILRYALNARRESLAQVALHNLIALHTSLYYMYRVAPATIPSPLSLLHEARSHFIEDLIVQVLEETAKPLDVVAITTKVNALDLLAGIREQAIRRHLSNLVASGYLQIHQNASTYTSYTRTSRAYSVINLDRVALRVLLGPSLYQQLEASGFQSLADALAHKDEFRVRLAALTGFSDGTAALLLAAVEAVIGPGRENTHLNLWHHADLIGSSHIRPYQNEAYSIFRGYSYRGQVIEAPTGSGKTMIGMLCIQDWLRSLSQGQSILVLVPTVNYQQQWVGELCYKSSGLHLSPHQVFTGTPATLEVARQRTGITPCVIVMTYAALSQTGSDVGKGGFDQDSVEIFLQGNTIQYVILDEVHKVVEDVHGISANVTRVLMDWLRDGSLKGVIGFSGTATAYRHRFTQLGLQLVYIMPAAELIAYGFVAPFAEFGVPFAYSDREQRIRDLLDAYKALMRDFVSLVGSINWRRWFAQIPMEERIDAALTLWRLSARQQDRKQMLLQRFEQWEQKEAGEELSLAELPIVTLVQLSKGWSDEDTVRAAIVVDRANGTASVEEGEEGEEGEGEEKIAADDRLTGFHSILQQLVAIRTELKSLVYLDDSIRRLSVGGFGSTFEVETVRVLVAEKLSEAVRIERVKDAIAPTIVGLYDSLSDWYLRSGEGRVDSIKAIIEAERASRTVHGVIIFDVGTRVRWKSGVMVPGYSGVAGVFGQLLGDERFTPMAVLSNEMYLAYNEASPLPLAIAAFIKREILRGELADALFGLATQEPGLQPEQLTELRAAFDAILERYVDTLTGVAAARPGEFYRRVLVPFRRIVRQSRLGTTGEKLLTRLSLKHYHIRNNVDTFFDYAMIIETFLKASVVDLIQVNGAHQKFFHVQMARGSRKQLMYDLTARIVDAEDLPVNVIIVSPWARTGWNVLKPNVLIDATATRNVIAWQQLRGRAMRARHTWTNECYRLVQMLMSAQPLHETFALPASFVDTTLYDEEGKEMQEATPLIDKLDEAARSLLREVHQKAHAIEQSNGSHMTISEPTNDGPLLEKIACGTLSAFTAEERAQLVTELMLAYNKVTHVYELVKAFGSTSQMRYDRAAHQWQRTESISAKHAHEYAVSPLSGNFTSGSTHAPLIYVGDPRRDVPSELEAHLTSMLKEADVRIIQGWLTTIATGIGEAIPLE